jgi:hypothetical protein
MRRIQKAGLNNRLLTFGFGERAGGEAKRQHICVNDEKDERRQYSTLLFNCNLSFTVI